MRNGRCKGKEQIRHFRTTAGVRMPLRVSGNDRHSSRKESTGGNKLLRLNAESFPNDGKNFGVFSRSGHAPIRPRSKGNP